MNFKLEVGAFPANSGNNLKDSETGMEESDLFFVKMTLDTLCRMNEKTTQTSRRIQTQLNLE